MLFVCITKPYALAVSKISKPLQNKYEEQKTFFGTHTVFLNKHKKI